MAEVHQPHDKDYKFKFKCRGAKMHNYIINDNCEHLEFVDTEESETGERKDIAYIANGRGYNAENESKPITINKVKKFHNYNRSFVCDKSNMINSVHTYCICTTKPQDEEIYALVDENYIFKLPVFYTKKLDGQKILNTLKNKVKKQERLTDDEQTEITLLADSNINISIKTLMKEIAHIVVHANISLNDRKELIACTIQTFKRFFEGDELSEMVTLFNKEAEDKKIAKIIETYCNGFDDVYKDGKYEGKLEGKLEDARNFLAHGVDEETISQCTGISIFKIQELKSEL